MTYEEIKLLAEQIIQQYAPSLEKYTFIIVGVVCGVILLVNVLSMISRFKQANVKLKEIGDKKIEVIKAVREFTSLGLAEAKALVEGLGMIKEGVNKEEAEKIVARMKEAGATAVME